VSHQLVERPPLAAAEARDQVEIAAGRQLVVLARRGGRVAGSGSGGQGKAHGEKTPACRRG
jgi:hypothetical protein